MRCSLIRGVFTATLMMAMLMVLGCSGSITSSTEMVFDSPDGALDPDEGVDATFTRVQEQIFTPSCALSGCHADFEFPRLTAARAYESIVGVTGGSGQPLIDPGNPANSYLYLKVTNAAGIRGGVMPQGGGTLSTAQIELLEAWIQEGALND